MAPLMVDGEATFVSLTPTGKRGRAAHERVYAGSERDRVSKKNRILGWLHVLQSRLPSTTNHYWSASTPLDGLITPSNGGRIGVGAKGLPRRLRNRNLAWAAGDRARKPLRFMLEGDATSAQLCRDPSGRFQQPPTPDKLESPERAQRATAFQKNALAAPQRLGELYRARRSRVPTQK
ncbi:hypothetical protein CGC20_18855 [Leishmania donovani]|uniref:Uncharacterized protein n=1 Tax=Leishmania donovani TaxID=5661 RepID=A0A504XMD2_LEIDO|nr:hypothetical protein CGC20_18855 [Leishmania donovani]